MWSDPDYDMTDEDYGFYGEEVIITRVGGYSDAAMEDVLFGWDA